MPDGNRELVASDSCAVSCRSLPTAAEAIIPHEIGREDQRSRNTAREYISETKIGTVDLHGCGS